MTATPGIVAHRGWATRYPENSLSAIRGALEAGIQFVEFDIQLSGDGVPVLIHDSTLTRTAGVDGCIHDLPWSRLQNETLRMTGRTQPAESASLPSLAQAVVLLGDYPRATAFVELKQESIERFGAAHCVSRCVEAIAPIRDRCVLTSFHDGALAQYRSVAALPVAWVLASYDDDNLDRARSLAPDFLFCNHRKLPQGDAPLPAGPWSWVSYEVRTAALARALAGRGVALVESMAVGELLADLAEKESGA